MSSPLFDRGDLRTVTLPDRSLRHYWTGLDWQLGTASFWEAVAAQTPRATTYRLTASITEEVGLCILGGFGVTWDTVYPAFERLRAAGVFENPTSTASEIKQLLAKPLQRGARVFRYRFPRQRSLRLAGALDYLSQSGRAPEDPRALRDWLTGAPGIGLKTASWVVRNLTASDEVAIIDVHIQRAGVTAGVFDPAWGVAGQYRFFESAFLQWAAAANAPASHLDSVIWAALSGRTGSRAQILGATGTNAVWPVETVHTHNRAPDRLASVT